MATNYSQGFYDIKNIDKYVGKTKPRFRSSWELQFMMWADNNPAVLKWASEPLRIPYRDPHTGKNTTYVPDFFIQYVDKSQKVHTEIIEIKPEKQQVYEKVGKNKVNQYYYVKNQAKWLAAGAYCRAQGMYFRILNENDLFHTGTKTKRKR